MREIIGTLTLRAINTDRDSFSDQVMIKASKDMEKLGIDILSCNIQNVTDEHGLIQDLGMDNTSKIRKDASIAKAEAERDIAIARQLRTMPPMTQGGCRDRDSQKNNELAIKKAELQKRPIQKKRRLTLPTRFRNRNSRKPSRPPRSTPRLPGLNAKAELRKQESDWYSSRLGS